MPKEIIPPLKDLFHTRSRAGAAVVTGVPGYHQLDTFSCGAAAVATVVCAYAGILDRDSWTTILEGTRPCPVEGTPTRRVTGTLRSLGLKVTVGYRLSRPLVTSAIRRGDLLITTLRMPGQDASSTHWVVIAGISPGDDSVCVLNNTGLPLFSRRWVPWQRLREARDPRESVLCVRTGLKSWVVDKTPERTKVRRPESTITRVLRSL